MTEGQEALRFYSTRDAFGEFSNFHPSPILLGGRHWFTSEHFYQAAKFLHTAPALAERIAANPRPKVAAEVARAHADQRRADWERVKLDAMRAALVAKFTQHEALGSLLLSTGDRPLEEASLRDSYWGTGADGQGSNWLGRLLVEVRTLLREGDEAAVALCQAEALAAVQRPPTA